MSFPAHLLDELARVFTRAALDRLIKEQAAREPSRESSSEDVPGESTEGASREVVDDVNMD